MTRARWCPLCADRHCRCGRFTIEDTFAEGIADGVVRVFSRAADHQGRYVHSVVDIAEQKVMEFLGHDLLYVVQGFTPGPGEVAFRGWVERLESLQAAPEAS